MSDTKNKIINAASQCFFQHGYTAASIAMISRYADLSRVTIHKHFCNKEDLFRQVVIDYMHCTEINLHEYQHSQKPFWPATKELLLKKCEKVFEEVNSPLVKSDLINAVQRCCQDIIDKRRLQAHTAIAKSTAKAIKNNELCLKELAMTELEFAKTLHQAAENFVMSTLTTSTEQSFINLLSVFMAATKVR